MSKKLSWPRRGTGWAIPVLAAFFAVMALLAGLTASSLEAAPMADPAWGWLEATLLGPENAVVGQTAVFTGSLNGTCDAPFGQPQNAIGGWLSFETGQILATEGCTPTQSALGPQCGLSGQRYLPFSVTLVVTKAGEFETELVGWCNDDAYDEASLFTTWTEPEPTPQPGLEVTKSDFPDPVEAGSALTYTIRLTNTGNVTLTATVTDTLPEQVECIAPSCTWQQGGEIRGDKVIYHPTINPGEAFVTQLYPTVTKEFSGALTNVVSVTTLEGPTGTAVITTTVVTPEPVEIYLPLVLRNHPPTPNIVPNPHLVEIYLLRGEMSEVEVGFVNEGPGYFIGSTQEMVRPFWAYLSPGGMIQIKPGEVVTQSLLIYSRYRDEEDESHLLPLGIYNADFTLPGVCAETGRAYTATVPIRLRVVREIPTTPTPDHDPTPRAPKPIPTHEPEPTDMP